MTKSIRATVLAIFLSGCAASATAPSFSEAPTPSLNRETAVLYVYREYAEPTLFTADLLMDEREIVSLPQKGFSWVYVEPGRHRFTFKWPPLASMPKVDFERDFEKNKVYVFEMRGRAGVTGVSGPAINYRLVSAIAPSDAESAKATMAKCCRYVAPSIRNE